MLLTLLYWIILVLAAVGIIAAPRWPWASSLTWLALFVIIGLKIFRTAI